MSDLASICAYKDRIVYSYYQGKDRKKLTKAEYKRRLKGKI